MDISLLTRDGSGLVECSQDLWVHVDVELSLQNDARVPSINPFPDPLGECLLTNSVDDVARELLGQLLPL